MIFNIVDKRSNKYAWMRLNAVVENTWQDNSVAGSDQIDPSPKDDMTYDQRSDISLHDAITWAEAMDARVTLYLYSPGEGIG